MDEINAMEARMLADNAELRASLENMHKEWSARLNAKCASLESKSKEWSGRLDKLERITNKTNDSKNL